MKIQKSKTKKILAGTFLSLMTLNLFFSCASNKNKPVPEKLPDYTEQDVHDAEVKRINEMLQTKPVEALWRAIVLEDKDLSDSCAKYVSEVISSSLEQGEIASAYAMYKSLVVSGYSSLAQSIISIVEMNKKYFDGIPALVYSEKNGTVDSVKNTPSDKISDYVDGTVTIWVDLGIKVQNGMGFANRVIGSGFFIDKRGYIITNHHVIAEVVDKNNPGYGKVYIKLSEDNDTRIPAKVIGWDSVHDLALLKTEVEPPYVFTLGYSSDLHVGDKIYAIGSPLGLERTLTNGVVSAIDRKLFTTGGAIQIDAAVNSGNSGGPCIDQHGNVQAVVFAGMLQYEGLNFAIPVEYVKQDLPMLYYGGERKISWLGAFGHTAKSGNRGFGLEVQYIMPGSTMARAGIETGSVIVAINGRGVKSLEQVQDVLRGETPGTIISVSYIKSDGQKLTKLLYLTERPKNPGYTVYMGDMMENSFLPLYGMSLTPSSTQSSRIFTIKKIIAGSTADESGFSENDPVTVGRIQFNPDKTAMFAEITIKRRKKGYLDISMGLPAVLDSPYYF